MHSHDSVLKKTSEYFNGDELASKVFVDKYALKTNDGKWVEQTPKEMHERIARELARIERSKFKKPLSYDEIFNLLDHFKFVVPQGSLLYGIGNDNQIVSLSNCYVVESPEDSYGGIHRADEHLTQICKRRGGTGLDISTLRPSRSPTRNSSRTSSGPVSFAARFSNTIREVGQDGRRGALMIMMNVHHPDILDFINAKLDKKQITGANISVKLTDEFMQAVEDGTEYEQRFPVDSDYPLVSQMVDARKVWKAIIKAAWESAEPGIVFWDNILKNSPADSYADVGFRTIATNPCSELPLCAYDSCRLMLLNLASYIVSPFGEFAKFNFDLFYEHAILGQRLMDDVVDLEIEKIHKIIDKIKSDPEPEHIKQRELELWNEVLTRCEHGRRTGLGTTALADAFGRLGIPYGSTDSIAMADSIYRTLKFGSYRSSVEMAKELGAFPAWEWEKEKNNPFLLRFREESITINGEVLEGYDLYHDISEFGRRNIANLTNSPAGTVSLLCQTSQGIEPVFELRSRRRKKVNPSDDGVRIDFIDESGDKWMEFEVLHPALKEWMEVTGKTDITESPWHGCCAKDLDWVSRVAMQGTIQQHIDHSISSTVNLPKNITQKAVGTIYEMAWKTGCKGMTVYRDGCRDGVILSVDDSTVTLPRTEAPERPPELKCDVHHTQVDGKPYFVIVGLWTDGSPYEVFAGRNGFLPKNVKTGRIVRKRKGYYQAVFEDSDIELSPITACSTELEGAITRLTSTSLRHGADMHTVVKQLEKVGETDSMNCFARGVSRVLKKYIQDGTKERGEICPECLQENLVRQSGCVCCMSCAWTKCS